MLAAIKAADPKTLANRQVVLSTGAANDGYVNPQMINSELDALRAKGVKLSNVVVMSIGGRLKHLNKQLGEIAAARGAKMAGEYRTRGQDVHPRSYPDCCGTCRSRARSRPRPLPSRRRRPPRHRSDPEPRHAEIDAREEGARA